MKLTLSLVITLVRVLTMRLDDRELSSMFRQRFKNFKNSLVKPSGAIFVGGILENFENR